MKKLLLTLTLAVCFMVFVNAQDYNTGIGLRLGFYNGLTVKHFIGEKSALEGIVATRWKGIGITGLYEIHNQLLNVDGVNWYFGLGGHVGFYDGDHTDWGKPDTKYTVIGVDGILGIEYNFSEVPISISADWKPAYDLAGNTKFWYDGGALSIRYIF